MQTATAPDGSPTSGWPVRPPIVLTLVYGTAVSFWFLWMMGTTQYPGVWEKAPFRIISDEAYLAFSATNAALALWLLLALRSALGSGAGLRRGHTAGAILGLALMALLQFGAQVLHRPWDGPVEDPEAIAEQIQAWDESTRGVVGQLRERLDEQLGDHRERWSGDKLHFQGVTRDGQAQGYLWQTGREGERRVRMQLFGASGVQAEEPMPEGLELSSGSADQAGLVIDVGADAEVRGTLDGLLRRWLPNPPR